MTTRPSTVTELAAVTFTDAQRKESPTPMSAQRAYSRAAESIALDLRDAYYPLFPTFLKAAKAFIHTCNHSLLATKSHA